MNIWDTALAHWATVGLLAWSFLLVLKWLAPYAPAWLGTLMAAG